MGQILAFGSDITVRVVDQASKLALATPVFVGENYIPHSIRSSVARDTLPFVRRQIRTYLSINEADFQVSLNYLGSVDSLEPFKFEELLEEFCYIADEWKRYLDEQGRQDLVYIPRT